MDVDVDKVGVVGAGQMGHGIAQVAAQAGCDVVLLELDQERLDRGMATIERQLARAVERGRLEASDADAARGRLHPTLDLERFADRDVVIEAITENRDAKLDIWRRLDGVVPADAVMASNTSSIPVIELAAATGRPERFVGLHFFHPVQVMNLIEVVETVATSESALASGFAFAERLGKRTVHVKDSAGFIVNRMLIPFLLDAIRVYEEGIGTIDQIDAAMKAGTGHPMGPFTLLDFIGLDTIAWIADVMWDEFKEKRFSAPPTLKRMVAAGFYGRKSGKGFYDYSGETPVPVELGISVNGTSHP